MMRFALLESGSKGNSFLLQDENTSILIDCGGTKAWLFQALKDTGMEIADLDALLITHDHSDHISQIRHFIDVPIYSPVSISGTKAEIIQPDQAFQIEHLTITPIALSHDTERTVGYVITSWQEKLVYITDTGYVKDEYLPVLKGADYIILESNHDTEMLMRTSRPMYLKMRIAGDSGHLCNEDCASLLTRIVSEKTKMVILAHISQQANTQETALRVSHQALRTHGSCRRDLILAAAGQNEIIKGGDWQGEKVDHCSCSCIVGMEPVSDGQLQ